ncbi:MAG TPA: hypothetical protein V6D20_07765, partial [Candidatus Obscuribacterales bacterium]
LIAGCDMLGSHHQEYRDGSYINNACPRCGWFVYSLEQWPYWDDNVATGSTDRVVRVRTFSEVVTAIRAAAKALVFPFLTLRLFSSWPLVGSVLALGYLGPWAVANANAFSSIYSGRTYGGDRYPRRNFQANPSDCGRRPEPLPRVRHEDALLAVLNAEPPKVYMDPSCSICLEDFEEVPPIVFA